MGLVHVVESRVRIVPDIPANPRCFPHRFFDLTPSMTKPSPEWRPFPTSVAL